MVKIFKSVEGSRSSMMDVEDEHNRMRAAFGLRYRIGQPGTPAAEGVPGGREPHFEGASAARLAALRWRAGHSGRNRPAPRTQRLATGRAHRQNRPSNSQSFLDRVASRTEAMNRTWSSGAIQAVNLLNTVS